MRQPSEPERIYFHVHGMYRMLGGNTFGTFRFCPGYRG